MSTHLSSIISTVILVLSCAGCSQSPEGGDARIPSSNPLPVEDTVQNAEVYPAGENGGQRTVVQQGEVFEVKGSFYLSEPVDPPLRHATVSIRNPDNVTMDERTAHLTAGEGGRYDYTVQINAPSRAGQYSLQTRILQKHEPISEVEIRVE